MPLFKVQDVPKNLTSFCRPINLAIFTECIVRDQDFIFNERGQYVLISMRICQKDRCGGDEDSFLMKWPPWSPDLFLCDFFLWRYMKGMIYVLSLPASIDELKQRISFTLDNATVCLARALPN